MNKIKMKKVFMIFMSLMFIMCLAGCKNNKQYRDDAIIIEVKSSYKNEFLNKEFKVNDFNFQNIDKLSYSEWYDSKNRGYIFIYLKKAGENKIEEAMKHINQLYFVEKCERMAIISLIE